MGLGCLSQLGSRGRGSTVKDTVQLRNRHSIASALAKPTTLSPALATRCARCLSFSLPMRDLRFYLISRFRILQSCQRAGAALVDASEIIFTRPWYHRLLARKDVF